MEIGVVHSMADLLRILLMSATGSWRRQTNDSYPTSVAGEFDAHFTNGHVLGAFGAELD